MFSWSAMGKRRKIFVAGRSLDERERERGDYGDWLVVVLIGMVLMGVQLMPYNVFGRSMGQWLVWSVAEQ